MTEYEDQLNQDLKAARKRVEEGVAATSFVKSPEGKLIQDWINERVSYLLESMTGSTPMPDREYLAAHGAVRELKSFNIMLQSKQRAGKAAETEVQVLNEQSAAVAGQEPIKF